MDARNLAWSEGSFQWSWELNEAETSGALESGRTWETVCKRKQCKGCGGQRVKAQSSGACDSLPESSPF